MKLTFKSLFITGFIFCTTFQLRAQAYPVEKVESVVPGKIIELPSKATWSSWYKTEEFSILASRNYTDDRVLYFQVFNKEATVQKLSFEYKREKGFDFLRFFNLDNKLYILTYKEIKHAKYTSGAYLPAINDYYYSEVNPESGTVSAPVKFLTGSSFELISSKYNDDKLFVKTATIKNAKEETTEISYVFFGENFVPEKEGKIMIPIYVEDANFYGENCDNGYLNLLVLVQQKKLNGLVMFSYNLEDGTQKATVLDLGVSYISNFSMDIQDNNTLVGYGLYNDEKSLKSDGVVSFRYNLSEGVVSNVSKTPFPKEIIQQFSEKSEIESVKMNTVYAFEDGMLYVTVSEKYGYNANSVNYGSIYIMAIDSEGSLVYSKKLPRCIVSASESDETSFRVMNQKDELVFFFLDSPKNENLNFNEVPERSMVTFKIEGDIVAYKLDKASGNISKYVLFNLDDYSNAPEPLDFSDFNPYSIVKLDEDRFQMQLKTDKKKLVLIKVTF